MKTLRMLALALTVLASASTALAVDTDGDGLEDADETTTWGTNPALWDTDGDGLSDGDEALHYPTDPLDEDSDDDGLKDGQEMPSVSGFGPPRSVDTEYAFPFAIDLNGDDRIDLAYSNDDRAAWVANQIAPGSSDFSAPISITETLSDPYAYWAPPFFGDVDHDGDPDLLRYQFGPIPDPPGFETWDFFYMENRVAEPTGGFADPAHQLLWLWPSALHDFDGDGDLDFLASDGCNVSWLRRESDAVMPVEQPGEMLYQTATPGACPDGVDVEVADVEGDGDLDIVLMEAPSSTVLWIENRLSLEGGGFEPAALLTTLDGWPHGFEVVNVDATPLPEIVVLTTPPLSSPSDVGAVTLVVLPNPLDLRRRSDPRLPVRARLADSIQGTSVVVRPLEVGDLDGDGAVDFVIGSGWLENTSSPESIIWVQNRLSGRLPRLVLGGEITPTSFYCGIWTPVCDTIRLADFDGDGRIDVLTTTTSSIAWFKNVIGTGSDPMLGDSDGDGLADGDEVTTHGTHPGRADTDGDGLTDDAELGALASDPLDPDSDHDGLLDGDELVMRGFGPEHAVASGISCCYRDIPGTTFGFTFGPNLGLADIDRDGDIDWLLGAGYDGISPFENRVRESEADFVQKEYGFFVWDRDDPPGFTIAQNAGGEVVGLLGTSYSSSAPGGTNGIVWYDAVYGPYGDLYADPNAIAVSTTAAGVERIQAIDLDGDGDHDVLAAERLDGEVVWYENRLDEVSADFAIGGVIDAAAAGTEGAYAADLDGDGDADVIVGAHDDAEIRWFENRLNEATADFGGPQLVTDAALDVNDLIAVDFDGDGDLDPVATSIDGYDVVWYENRLDLAEPFVARSTAYQTYGAGRIVEIAGGDLDRNGKDDLVYTLDEQWKLIAVVFSEGTTAFVQTEQLSTSFGSLGDIELADLDGDGDLDLTVTGYGQVAWFENLINFATAVDDPDSDDDGLLDGFEVEWGENPLVATDTSADADGDGLDLLAEQAANTSPLTDDTDGDGAPDDFEIAKGTDPLDRLDVPTTPVPEFGPGGLVVLVLGFCVVAWRRLRGEILPA